MEMDVDTFLVAVYAFVDDEYQATYAAEKPVRPGASSQVSDSEVLTLALLEQWYPAHSEAGFVASVRTHWQAYFPRMLSQSAFNRRVRDLAGLLARLGPDVAEQVARLTGTPEYEVIDAVPVPLMRRCRGERHRLFAAEAQVGRGGSDRDWYYGCSLLDAVSPEGVITGCVVGPANTEGRWLAETLFRWRGDPAAPVPTADELRPVLGPHHRTARRGPTGPIRGRLAAGRRQTASYLGDRGFAGRSWQRHWQTAYGACVVTPGDRGVGPQHRRWYAAARQVRRSIACWSAPSGWPSPAPARPGDSWRGWRPRSRPTTSPGCSMCSPAIPASASSTPLPNLHYAFYGCTVPVCLGGCPSTRRSGS
jgi:hypothetical protein